MDWGGAVSILLAIDTMQIVFFYTLRLSPPPHLHLHLPWKPKDFLQNVSESFSPFSGHEALKG